MIHTPTYKTFTFISLRVLIVVGLLFLAATAKAATLSLSPGTGVYTAGQTFTARVVVNTAGKTINAAEGLLKFNPAELSVVGISKGSIFNLWTAEPSFSNSAGTVRFSGGATPPGYKGAAGTALNITFRVKNAGNPRVTFGNGAVLAADGRGTNVLTSMNGGSYTIAAQEVVPEPETIEYIAPANTPAKPEIISDTKKSADGWYDQNSVKLSWTLPSDVTAVRTLLDSQSGTIPTKVYDSPIRTIELTDLDEGVQYFHIQFKNADGWGRVAHYRVPVDTQNPSHFNILLSEAADLSDPNQQLVLETEDASSEVMRFLVQVDGSEPYEYIDEHASGTIMLPSLDPGHHTVLIEAFDEAGNSLIDTFSFEILAFDKPYFDEYPAEIAEDVIPVFKGKTRPLAKVTVRVTKLGADTQKTEVQADADGVFIYIPENRFSLGVYELSARAVDQYGAQSEQSEVIRVAVQQPGYLRIGSIMVNVLSVLVPLVALVGLLLFMLWFMFVRVRKLRAGVLDESSEALAILREEFRQLREALETQVVALKNTRKTKKLTKAESALVAVLEAELKDSESKVAKEITDVEKIVE